MTHPMLKSLLLRPLTEGGSVSTEVAQEDNARHGPIFQGCYDWHSACHGRWALLDGGAELMAMEEPSDDESGVEHSGFSAVAINLQTMDAASEWKQVRRYLAENPDFEMPYGRAWLLLLFVRMKQWNKMNSNVPGQKSHLYIPEEFALEVVNGLVQYLRGLSKDLGIEEVVVEESSFPALTLEVLSIPEYKNPAWIVIQLFEYAGLVGDAALAEGIRRRVAYCFGISSKNRANKHATPQHSGSTRGTSPNLLSAWVNGDACGFFSIWGVQALLILKVLGEVALRGYWADVVEPALSTSRGTSFVQDTLLHPIPIETFAPIVSGKYSRDVHRLSINATKAWGLWALWKAMPDNPQFKNAYHRHLLAQFALHEIPPENW
eukprot:CAMPEP_0183717452 /NCGR_PEP_ID=MMETSP0737-20130205/11062_1 /TAXON_ID=385413 /ORGANISM="Thalassiosira miniscula, Strain CCMP1093" /LENGTH=376 /DNA_ID=CAMNT_0025946901 /DNA_START=126 /DNA_END=1253 /DNA_ORIENTATION=-